ncbi:MAG: coniferyl aldehyde dehydrogenase, partial [Lentisphaeria bacterium]
CEQLTIINDIIPTLNAIKYCKKNIKKWTTPESRKKGLLLSHGKLKVQYQPLGVVGIMVPWNFPLNLALTPLVYAIAAGNRVMIKLSELTPNFNSLLKSLFNKVFADDEIYIVTGDSNVAEQFSKLPFNHLLFTGSTSVGKKIMANAAANLTPVTLELGGKSPAIIVDDYSIVKAAKSIVYGKTLNAGQVCIAPDYLLIPNSKIELLCQEIKNQFIKMFPNLDNYTSIINQHHFSRLQTLISEAKMRQEIVLPCSNIIVLKNKILPLHLIINPSLNSKLMTDEIFGPILPIITYQKIDEAIKFINERPHPLALYLFTNNKKIQNQVLESTISGGVTINDTIIHIAADDAPFGGVGASGIGAYHAIEGFKTFSHAKTILHSNTTINPSSILHPPYKSWLLNKIITFFTK